MTVIETMSSYVMVPLPEWHEHLFIVCNGEKAVIRFCPDTFPLETATDWWIDQSLEQQIKDIQYACTIVPGCLEWRDIFASLEYYMRSREFTHEMETYARCIRRFVENYNKIVAEHSCRKVCHGYGTLQLVQYSYQLRHASDEEISNMIQSLDLSQKRFILETTVQNVLQQTHMQFTARLRGISRQKKQSLDHILEKIPKDIRPATELKLDDDVLCHIFSFLTVSDLEQIQYVNHYFLQLAQQPISRTQCVISHRTLQPYLYAAQHVRKVSQCRQLVLHIDDHYNEQRFPVGSLAPRATALVVNPLACMNCVTDYENIVKLKVTHGDAIENRLLLASDKFQIMFQTLSHTLTVLSIKMSIDSEHWENWGHSIYALKKLQILELWYVHQTCKCFLVEDLNLFPELHTAILPFSRSPMQNQNTVKTSVRDLSIYFSYPLSIENLDILQQLRRRYPDITDIELRNRELGLMKTVDITRIWPIQLHGLSSLTVKTEISVAQAIFILDKVPSSTLESISLLNIDLVTDISIRTIILAVKNCLQCKSKRLCQLSVAWGTDVSSEFVPKITNYWEPILDVIEFVQHWTLEDMFRLSIGFIDPEWSEIWTGWSDSDRSFSSSIAQTFASMKLDPQLILTLKGIKFNQADELILGNRCGSTSYMFKLGEFDHA